MATFWLEKSAEVLSLDRPDTARHALDAAIIESLGAVVALRTSLGQPSGPVTAWGDPDLTRKAIWPLAVELAPTEHPLMAYHRATASTGPATLEGVAGRGWALSESARQ